MVLGMVMGLASDNFVTVNEGVPVAGWKREPFDNSDRNSDLHVHVFDNGNLLSNRLLNFLGLFDLDTSHNGLGDGDEALNINLLLSLASYFLDLEVSVLLLDILESDPGYSPGLGHSLKIRLVNRDLLLVYLGLLHGP